MASLRRSKTLSPDGQTARFLYTILKQLDLKAIDWNLVADSLNITNGHAARMRFSRFKQHMEGIPTQPRTPRPKKEGAKDGKGGKGRGSKRGFDADEQGEERKVEGGQDREVNFKEETMVHVKAEPATDRGRGSDGEPPAVRIKREPDLNNNAWQAVNERLTGTTVNTSQKPALGSTPLLPSATNVVDGRLHLIPTTPTVSLADLQLSPQPSTSTVRPESPNHCFEVSARTAAMATGVERTRVKPEADLVEHGRQRSCTNVLKCEPAEV